MFNLILNLFVFYKMFSLNKVMLIGYLGRTPEIRSTNEGKMIVNFSLATTDSWKDKMTGERRGKTEWHRVTVFNERLVKVIKDYATKGSKLYIEGQLQTRKWTDNEARDHYTTEVVLQNFNSSLILLDSKNNTSVAVESGSTDDVDNDSEILQSQSDTEAFDSNEMDDEIPF
jgi:single-strand DNA-binding protein